MSQDFFDVLRYILFNNAGIWGLFNRWHLPGTNITPAGIFMFILFSDVALRWLTRVINSGSPSSIKDTINQSRRVK